MAEKGMQHKEHPLNMGMLLVNFQSLEFALRLFLLNDEIVSGVPSPLPVKFNAINEGDIVPENAFTNYDNLSQLIEKYNHHPKIISESLTIDRTLVDTRDAIAHGRVASLNPLPMPPFRLLKFDKPKNKRVKVTFSVLLTREWYITEMAKVQSAVFNVFHAIQITQSAQP